MGESLSEYQPPKWDPLTFLVSDPQPRQRETSDEILFNGLKECFEKASEIREKYLQDQDEPPEPYITGFEVGDDRVDYSNSAVALSLAIHIQEKVFLMKTSWKDTYISSDNWNFCEVTSFVPYAPEESFPYARKSSLDRLGFNDFPTLRTVLGVMKGGKQRSEHSSTVAGKSQLLGSRGRTPRTSNKLRMEIASWLQDGTLMTSRSADPKYLPREVAGSSAPPLFGNVDNSFLYLHAFKNGSYKRIYASAINELRQAVNNLHVGLPAATPLCKFLRTKGDYLHATYAHEIFFPRASLKSKWEEAPVPIYLALGTSPEIQGAENRLVSARKLLTKSQAEVEILRSRRISEALFAPQGLVGFEREESERMRIARQGYDYARTANAAIQRLLMRQANGAEPIELLKAGFLHSVSGVQELDRASTTWIVLGGRGEAFNVQDIPQSEDMFLVEEVSLEQTMRVPGIPLSTIFNHRVVAPRLTESRLGLWEVTQSQTDWAEGVISQLKESRLEGGSVPNFTARKVLLDNPEWINDDTLIIAKCQALTRKVAGSVVIVTSDFRLCRNASRMSGLTVWQLEPRDLIARSRTMNWRVEDIASRAKELIESYKNLDEFGPPIIDYIGDSGSFEAYAVKTDTGFTNSGERKLPLYRKELVSTGINSNGDRFAEYRKTLLGVTQTCPVTVISPNGQSQRLHLDTVVRPDTRPPGLLSRSSRLVQRFARGKVFGGPKGPSKTSG